MGIVAPKTTSDRFRHGFTNMHPDLDGNLSLEPTNFCWNWNFGVLDYDGDPELFEIGIPEDAEGIFVYMSQKNKGIDTMAAQTTSPVDVEEDSWTLAEPHIPGHSPVLQSRQAAIAPPGKPTVKKIPASKNGFAAGTYWVSYSWFEGSVFSTPISPAIQVTVLQGQYIRVTIPTSAPEDATRLGIWLSSVNGSTSTMRLQQTIDVRRTRPTTILLKGPWKAGRSVPVLNETADFFPQKPGGRKRKGKRPGVPGQYRAQIAEVLSNGLESYRSDWSDPVEITQDEADSHVEFEPIFNGNIPIDAELLYKVYVDRDGEIYELDDESVGGSIFQAASRTSSARSQAKRKKPRVSGRQESQNQARRMRRNNRMDSPSDSLRRGSRGAVSGEEYNSEYGSTNYATEEVDEGIEPPGDVLEGAVAEGAAVLDTPGTYKVALSYWARGQETAISEIETVNLLAGETMRVYFPDQANYFRNSQWVDLDADGLPDGWVFSGVAGGGTQGTYRIDADHTLVLDTLGDRTSGQLSPQMSQTVEVNRARFYAVGGLFSTDLTSGNAEVILEELNDAGTTVFTHVLKSTPSDGIHNFEKVVGVGYTAFQSTTVSVRLTVRFGPSNATRNGLIRISELFMHAHNRPLRRREYKHKIHVHHRHRGRKRKHHKRKHSKPNTRSSVRWEKNYHLGVEEPPVYISRYSAEASPMSPITFESNAFPTDWTMRSSNPAGVTNTVNTSSKIDGVYGWKNQKTTTAAAYTYLFKDFRSAGANRERLAIRARFRIVARPNKSALTLLNIGHAQADNTTQSPGWIRLDSSGYVRLYGRSSSSGGTTYLSLGTVVVGDVLDIELRVRAAGTGDTIVEAGMGKNGGAIVSSSLGASYNSYDWGANFAMVGASAMDDTSLTYNFDIDSIVASNSGNVAIDVSAPPALIPYPTPDRPYKDPITYQEVNFDQNKNLLPNNPSRGGSEGTLHGVSYYNGWETIYVTDEQAWHGQNSIVLDTANAVANSPYTVHGIRFGGSTSAQVAANQNVVCSVYVKAPAGVDFELWGSSAQRDAINHTPYTGTGDWQRCEIPIWTETSAFNPGFMVRIWSTEGPQYIFLDGAQIEAKNTNGATAWEPGTKGNLGGSDFQGSRSPADATTALTLGASYAIDGTQGLRMSSTNGGSVLNFRDLGAGSTLQSSGLRFRVRVVTRPTSGTVHLMNWLTTTGGAMATVTLNSAGELHAYTTFVGGSSTPTKIAENIVNGNVLTLEMNIDGANTQAGLATFWVAIGGTGAIANRQLMHQESSLNWSGRPIRYIYMGPQGSGAGQTYAFDYDSVYWTQYGETVFDETTEDGRPIYQVHMWFPPGQPVRQDLYLKGYRAAVRPGAQYTASVKARHAGLVNTAQPYFFTTYDADGTEHPLGSLYGNAGATGTMGWTTLTRTFTIPANCYEVVMHSKDIAQGEFCCQSFAFSRGTTAVREVKYPQEGRARIILDTRTAEQHISSKSHNVWLDLNCIVDTPPGTTANIQYGSAKNTVLPDKWETDRKLVPTSRYAHVNVVLKPNATRTVTPVITDNSPYVDFYRAVGDKQVHALLRENLSEFTGGTTLSGVQFPRDLSVWDVFSPRGKLQRHRRWPGVGQMPGFKINVYTEATMVELEQQCMAEDFYIETRDRRIRIRFGTQLAFVVKPESPRKIDEKWYFVAEAQCEPVEIVSVDPMVGLAPSETFTEITV